MAALAFWRAWLNRASLGWVVRPLPSEVDDGVCAELIPTAHAKTKGIRNESVGFIPPDEHRFIRAKVHAIIGEREDIVPKGGPINNRKVPSSTPACR